MGGYGSRVMVGMGGGDDAVLSVAVGDGGAVALEVLSAAIRSRSACAWLRAPRGLRVTPRPRARVGADFIGGGATKTRSTQLGRTLGRWRAWCPMPTKPHATYNPIQPSPTHLPLGPQCDPGPPW